MATALKVTRNMENFNITVNVCDVTSFKFQNLKLMISKKISDKELVLWRLRPRFEAMSREDYRHRNKFQFFFFSQTVRCSQHILRINYTEIYIKRIKLNLQTQHRIIVRKDKILTSEAYTVEQLKFYSMNN